MSTSCTPAGAFHGVRSSSPGSSRPERRRCGQHARRLRQHPGRRGRETLALSARLMGVPDKRADELLGLVGLDRSAARKRVRQYSLGMRQRLGLAHALLGDPEVLILDEPANGLDPEGMRWMRSLLRDFADRGGTVLLSSHLLHEVEAVADQLVIIGGGRIAAQGSRAELLAGAGTLVRAADPAALSAALEAAGLRRQPGGRRRLRRRRRAGGRRARRARGRRRAHPPRPVGERRARAAVLRSDRGRVAA